MLKTSLSLSALTVCAGLVGFATTAAAATGASDLGYSSHSGNYLIGRAASRQRDYDTAASYYLRAYEENSGDPVILERAFVLNVTSGRLEKAADLASQIITLRKDHQLARFVLGLYAARQKDFATARLHFAQAAKNRIGQLTSAVLIAWTYAGENRRKRAYAALDALDSQRNLNKFKAANKAYLADFLKDTKQGLESFAAARGKSGNSMRLIDSYGTFLWRVGRKDQAKKVFENYLKTTRHSPLIASRLANLNNNKPAPVMINSASEGMFEVLFSLASALSEQKNTSVALIYTQLGLYVKPNQPVAQVLLGELFDLIKKRSKAIEAYSKVPESSPLRNDVDIQIASDLDDLGKTDAAIARLDQVIARDPGNFQALSSKGSILYAHQKWTEAARALSLALARVPEKKRRHWVVYYYRGMSYERAGKWEKAEPDFKMALKLRPAHPSVLNYLGYSWIDRGENLDEALNMVKQAAQLRPRDGYIVDSVGWAYYRLGHYKQAVKYLERAVKLRPGDPTINDHLGDAYWKVGRKLEAKFQWAHARDSKPEKKALTIILNKIKNGLVDSSDKS